MMDEGLRSSGRTYITFLSNALKPGQAEAGSETESWERPSLLAKQLTSRVVSQNEFCESLKTRSAFLGYGADYWLLGKAESF
jgi:hypothetical protein